jgi:hypothetical protein
MLSHLMPRDMQDLVIYIWADTSNSLWTIAGNKDDLLWLPDMDVGVGDFELSFGYGPIGCSPGVAHHQL